MSGPISKQEMDRYLSKQMGPDELREFSRRLAEFGTSDPAKEASGIASRFAIEEEPVPYEMIRAYVLGELDSEEAKYVDEVRALDPDTDDAIRAFESAQREVAASLSMSPAKSEATPKPKRSWLGFFTMSGGWALAGASAVFMFVALPKLTDERSELTQEVERLEQRIKDIGAPVLPSTPSAVYESILSGGIAVGAPTLQNGDEIRATILGAFPGNSFYASLDGITVFGSPVSERLRRFVLRGSPEYNESYSKFLETFSDRSEVLETLDRTFILDSTPLRFRWREIEGAKEYAVVVRRSGRVVAEDSGIEVGAWNLVAQAPGEYEWELRVAMSDGSTQSHIGRFRVTDSVAAMRLIRELLGSNDPLSKAVLLAEEGYRDDALFVLSGLGGAESPSPLVREVYRSIVGL
ncbi:MAG: hypothetical protein KIT74_01670 [Fimbriimonadales bacterium]|nr:hypothetical protein [Fimbriimonadales bacterium]